MKKIYQKPTINIVKVQVNNILTVSDFNQNPDKTNTVNGSQALGRAWYEWDD
jgi:hypothetical protein